MYLDQPNPEPGCYSCDFVIFPGPVFGSSIFNTFANVFGILIARLVTAWPLLEFAPRVRQRNGDAQSFTNFTNSRMQ